MAALFLFTGENAYALRQEVSRWAKEFREKHGEANLIRLEAEGLNLSAFLNETASAPFIAEHRLVMVEGIPDFSTPEAGKKKGQRRQLDLSSVFAQVHPQTIVLFVEPKPDRRLNVVKELFTLATVRDFPQLKGDALLRWVQVALQDAGASVDREVPSLLVDCVGGDQQVLAREVEKLSLFASGRPVTGRDIEELTLPSSEQTIWHLLDLLGEGRAEAAVMYCRGLLKRGESAQSIWNILLWIVVSLVSIASAVEEGTTSIQGVMQATGVKFGAARSLIPLARRCKLPVLRSLLERVTDTDVALKTGAYKSSGESDEELAALLDCCLMAFPR